MRALFIPNLKARQTSSDHIELLMHVAPLYGGEVDVLPNNDSPEEMEFLVKERLKAKEYERIICFGGDGTINRIVRAIQGTNIPLGIIPTGTANLLSHELGLPVDPQVALEIALTGKVVDVDLGMINGLPFVDMAGFGFDGRVVSRVDLGIKDLLGPLAYVAAGIKEIATYKKSRFTIDGEDWHIDVDAWLLVVCNLPGYGYNNVQIIPDAKFDDGYLNFCLFTEDTAIDRLSQIGSVMIKKPEDNENIHLFKARKVKVATDPPVDIQVDGDYFGNGCAEIEVIPGGLKVIAPDDYL